MSGLCDTCKRSNVCRKPIGGIESCRLYVRAKESNYEKLFGTPAMAARTLAGIVTADGCVDCALLDATCCRNKDAWLEWLRGDA